MSDREKDLQNLIGLGNSSSKKSYYPELQRKIHELDREKSFINDIIDSMPSLIICLDNIGNITRINKSTEIRFNTDVSKIIGHQVIEFIPYIEEELKEYFFQEMSKSSISGIRKSRKEENSTVYEEIFLYPLTKAGNGEIVLRIDDITERVRLEETVIQSEKMLSLGGLAAGMAHEINNPLAGIMQTASVLSKRLTDCKLKSNKDTAEKTGVDLERLQLYMEERGIFRMLEGINKAGQRASSIIQNMLSFSRREDQALSFHDPVELMENILELAAADFDLKKHYDFKNIEIIREYETDLPHIPCSRSQIQQVILNLLKNGAEAMAEESIQDYKPRFILRLRKETKKLFMEIEDNGPGLNDEERKRVFEPFFTTKPTGSGTGLGLSVSYFIITENHKGTMEVSSVPGKGTRFTIGLPLYSQASESPV